MSVKHRSKNERRQRRRKRLLALPFIVSFALVPAACTKSDSKADKKKPRIEKTSNPPEPRRNPRDKPPTTNPTPTTANKLPAKKLAAIPKGAKGQLTVAKNECTFEAEPNCPKNVPCNPPAARKVKCPPDLPKLSKGVHEDGRVHQNKKGECIFSFDEKCDPGDKCNPPPPRKVKCW